MLLLFHQLLNIYLPFSKTSHSKYLLNEGQKS